MPHLHLFPEATIEGRIQIWCALMDACEELLLAGLRREMGPDADIRKAFRAWYAAAMEEHDQEALKFLASLDRRTGRKNAV